MKLKRGNKKRFKAILSELQLADMFHGEVVEDRISQLENDLLDYFEEGSPPSRGIFLTQDG